MRAQYGLFESATSVPSAQPSPAPTVAPSTALPSSRPTAAPSFSTATPTAAPSTAQPSAAPSISPSLAPSTAAPSLQPSQAPTSALDFTTEGRRLTLLLNRALPAAATNFTPFFAAETRGALGVATPSRVLVSGEAAVTEATSSVLVDMLPVVAGVESTPAQLEAELRRQTLAADSSLRRGNFTRFVASVVSSASLRFCEGGWQPATACSAPSTSSALSAPALYGIIGLAVAVALVLMFLLYRRSHRPAQRSARGERVMVGGGDGGTGAHAADLDPRCVRACVSVVCVCVCVCVRVNCGVCVCVCVCVCVWSACLRLRVRVRAYVRENSLLPSLLFRCPPPEQDEGPLQYDGHATSHGPRLRQRRTAPQLDGELHRAARHR